MRLQTASQQGRIWPERADPDTGKRHPKTHDTAPDDNRLTIRVILGLLVAILIIAALMTQFGLIVLGFTGIAAAVVVLAVLLSFTTGN